MTKYFAQDTPQASLERMMMSVPGFQRRGGGISFSSFHYKPEDVDCQYCLHYRRKSCQIPICPYIAERLASGALEYHDLILECLGRNLRLRLYQRIRSVTHWDGPDQAILYKIRPYCQKAANRPQEDIPSVYWAALYLLASRESLWKTAVPALASGYIDFHCISCRGLAVRDYPIFYSAKRLYERKFPMDAGELASRSLIDDQDFLNILYATLIARYLWGGKTVVKGDFSQRFYNSQPITRERFDELAILRLENTGKVTGAFEINLDAGWISGLCITDGWQTFQIKDVSAAAYHATRSSRMSLEDRWKKFINRLDGNQIEPESFASAEIGGLRPLEKGDILCIDGPFLTDRELKFRLDVSSYGVQKEVLNLMTDCSKPENSLEITCSYDAARQGISNKLDLTLRQKNGMVRHDFFYPLMEEERAHLLKIVEQFCQQHTGKTLNDYYAQLDMERETPPELTAGIKRLSIDAVSFSDEITECDGKLNFYIPINFDPDEVFGTNVASAFNDDWLNVYANFDWKTGRIDSALTVCLVCSDGHEFEFSYPLTPAEQAQLWDKMDAYCRQQNGQSLEEARAALLQTQAEEGMEIRM